MKNVMVIYVDMYIYIYTRTFSVIYNILFIVSYVCVAIYNLYSSGILVLMGDTYSCLLLIFLFNGDIISTFICLMVRPSINPVWPLIQPFISIYIYITLTFETTKQLPVWSGYVLKKKLVYTLTRAPIIAPPLISSSHLHFSFVIPQWLVDEGRA